MSNLAVANLWQRKTRSAMSVFGIAIGVALLLVLKGLLLGTIDEITDRMKNTGVDIYVFKKFEIWGGTEQMPARFGEEIEKQIGLERIEPIIPIIQDKIKSVGKAHQENRVWGVSKNNLRALRVKLAGGEGGRFFENGTGDNPSYEMLIDTRLVAHSGLNVGDTVTYLKRDWKIVGVFEQGVGVRVFVPFDTIQKLKFDRKGASIFAIKCKPGVKPQEIAADIKEVKINGEKLGVFPLVSEEMHKTFTEDAKIINDFANYVTIVAMSISFLVILLTMYTVVVERTRDIGILKSLGATRFFIARAIITESLILCTLGVGVGIGMSLFAAWLIPIISLLNVTISPEWMLIATVVGLAGGVLGAFYPAAVAASKDPVVALTYE